MAIQKTRPLGLTTPLGEDVLLLRAMSGTEQLGRLFRYELSVLSPEESVKMDDILGQNVTVRLDVEGADEPRFFNGFVSRFAQTGRSQGYATYRVSVRPWLWFLTRRQDCRIFQELTVPQILKEVFQGHGFSDVEESFGASYGKWEYCVQYRETDFDFVSRLMEHEGIYYYFKHEDGKHTLVLSDGYGSHSLLPGYEKVPYYPPSDNATRPEEHVYDWSITREVMAGQYTLQDYDFEKPRVDLTTKSKITRKHSRGELEVYDYPGEYIEEDDGKSYVKARIEELQWQHEQVNGAADARGFLVGGMFELTGHPREDQNREYLIVSTSYDLQSNEFESGGSADEAPEFSVRFSAIESKTPYRTPRYTPKPVIQGPQTAMVVGPSGSEIYTDKYGRVKVQFHWDRLGKRDENSSCWIRVAQVWAGKTWGGIQIPRIGHEVMVEFLEGDPDLPIITGRVYNAEAMPPYGLPDNATQSGIKSRSSKEGSGDNFNEIRFEDKKGSEELYLHAEKNHTNITENDRSEDVGHDRSLHVGHDKSEKIDNNKAIVVGVDHEESIGANKKLSVGANHTESIGANKTLSVGANHEETIGSSMTVTVASMLTETVGINYAETVGAAMELTIGAAFTETVGAIKAQTIGANKTVNIGMNHSVDVGGNESRSVGGGKTVTVGKDLGETISGGHTESVTKAYSLQAKSVSIVAEDEISVKTGDAMLLMKKDGTINIKGKDIVIEGSGQISIDASKDVVLKGKNILQN